MTSPVQPAYFARLNAADSEIKRRQKEVLEGVMSALSASKEGKDHPRLWTQERKDSQYRAAVLRKQVMETSYCPPLPQIIVTEPLADWRGFTSTIRGRFGATRQE